MTMRLMMHLKIVGLYANGIESEVLVQPLPTFSSMVSMGRLNLTARSPFAIRVRPRRLPVCHYQAHGLCLIRGRLTFQDGEVEKTHRIVWQADELIK